MNFDQYVIRAKPIPIIRFQNSQIKPLRINGKEIHMLSIWKILFK